MVSVVQAVESKQVAQQEAERARFVVMKAEQVRCGHAALRCSGCIRWPHFKRSTSCEGGETQCAQKAH